MSGLEQLDELPIFEPIKSKAVFRANSKKRDATHNRPVFEFRNGVWQYILDHAVYDKSRKAFRVFFFCDSEEQFWNHVEARRLGHFRRHSVKELVQKETDRLIKKREERKEASKIQTEVQQKEEKIKTFERGTLKQRAKAYLIKKLRSWLEKMLKSL